jgi:hypothetical protein
MFHQSPFFQLQVGKYIYKCCWKVSRGIAILIGNTNADSIGISNETSDSNTN